MMDNTNEIWHDVEPKQEGVVPEWSLFIVPIHGVENKDALLDCDTGGLVLNFHMAGIAEQCSICIPWEYVERLQAENPQRKSGPVLMANQEGLSVLREAMENQ